MVFKKRTAKTRKRTPARKTRVRSKKMHKRGMKASSNCITFYSKSQMPLPTMYKCKFVIFGKCILGAGLTDNSAGVKLNSPYIPFNNAAQGAFATMSPASATNQPVGLTNLWNSSMYQNFRIYASKIDIKISQVLATDTAEITVIPAVTGAQMATLAGLQPEQLPQIPFSKYIITTQARQNHISNYMTCHKLLGVPKAAIDLDLSNNFTGALGSDPAGLMYWYINIRSSDQEATLNDIVLDVKVTYYTELWRLYDASLHNT
nr:MAG: capsid protein [Cressdnaviricota sp.]